MQRSPISLRGPRQRPVRDYTDNEVWESILRDRAEAIARREQRAWQRERRAWVVTITAVLLLLGWAAAAGQWGASFVPQAAIFGRE